MKTGKSYKSSNKSKPSQQKQASVAKTASRHQPSAAKPATGAAATKGSGFNR